MTTAQTSLARQVLSKNLKVRRGESVVLEAWTHSLPLVPAFVAEARRLGARPTVLYEDEGAWWQSASSPRRETLRRMSPAERALLAETDVFLYFWGPEDRPRLDALSETKRDEVTAWNEEWYRIARRAGLRGCRMTLAQATDPVALAWGLDGPSWRERLLRAGSVDAEAMRRKGYRLAALLEKGSELRLTHPNGTDLHLRLKGVHTQVASGIPDPDAMGRPYGLLANNPSGQVMVGIDASEAHGTFVSNRAVYVGPHAFDGVRWSFEDGRLVDHAIGRGAEAFETAFAAAGPGRDRTGYLSIGLNPHGRDLPPCEDTEEGALILGIGGNAFAGGRLRLPFQGYGLLGEGTISVDGRTVAAGGRVR